nr:hypothetical protein [uncultured Desulfobacter sp.]
MYFDRLYFVSNIQFEIFTEEQADSHKSWILEKMKRHKQSLDGITGSSAPPFKYGGAARRVKRQKAHLYQNSASD